MENQGLPKSFIVIIASIAFIVLFGSSMFYTINPGEKGVLFKKFGGGLDKETIYGQGFHVVAPWNELIDYDVKIQETFEKMEVLSKEAQWFEDNSPLMPEHKKDSVTGVSYKTVIVAGEAGDASPSTPIGVNLPNANWIRAAVGSKSVSLGNIINVIIYANNHFDIERILKTNPLL